MTTRNDAALDFLLSRRSRPQKTLRKPVPDKAALETILTAALRTPDHGKIEPWRLIVLEEKALRRLADIADARAKALGKNEADRTKARQQFDTSALAVAVVESPDLHHPKVPVLEQTYSTGAVCLALLNAALASGWGANWLSGWISHDESFRTEALGLEPHERIAGLIHIGTETNTPPERPRPELHEKVRWISA